MNLQLIAILRKLTREHPSWSPEKLAERAAHTPCRIPELNPDVTGAAIRGILSGEIPVRRTRPGKLRFIHYALIALLGKQGGIVRTEKGLDIRRDIFRHILRTGSIPSPFLSIKYIIRTIYRYFHLINR